MAERLNSKIPNRIEKIVEELDRMPNSITVEEAQMLHKELSYISADNLLRRFTI